MELNTIREIVQAGDTFLIRFKCPTCGHHNFEAYPLKSCSKCLQDLRAFELVLPENRTKYRILCGTVRKRRLGKRSIQHMLRMQGGGCAYCYTALDENLHVEHIIPLAVGGTNNANNLALSCPTCNLIAGSKVFNDFSYKQAYVLERRYKKQK